MAKARDEANKEVNKLRDIVRSNPTNSFKRAQMELERLEREQSTTSMSLSQEKALLQRMKELRKELKEFTKLENIRKTLKVKESEAIMFVHYVWMSGKGWKLVSRTIQSGHWVPGK